MNFERYDDGDFSLQGGRFDFYLIYTKYSWNIGVGIIISPPSGAVFSFSIDLLCFSLGGHIYKTKQKW